MKIKVGIKSVFLNFVKPFFSILLIRDDNNMNA